MSTGDVCTHIIGLFYMFHGSLMPFLSGLPTKVRGRRGRYVFHLITISDRTTTTKHESKPYVFHLSTTSDRTSTTKRESKLAQVPSNTQQARRLFSGSERKSSFHFVASFAWVHYYIKHVSCVTSTSIGICSAVFSVCTM